MSSTFNNISTLDMGETVEVPKPLSEEEIQSYIDQGFLVGTDLVSEDEVEEICEDMIRIARGGYPSDYILSDNRESACCAQGTARNFCKYYFGKALGRMLRGERCELSKHFENVRCWRLL